MKEALISFIDNPVKVKIFRIIILSIIGLIILDQVYSLTQFIYQYSKNFDYGKMLRETCKNSYIEYETERFQLSNNIMNIKIDNDNYNNKYNIIILLVSIFVTMFIVFIFTYIYINSIFEDSLSTLASIIETIGKAQGSKLEMMGAVASQVYDIVGEMFGKIFKGNNILENLNKLFDFIIFIGKILSILYIVLIIPLYLILKFNNNIDISPFTLSNDKLNVIIHPLFLAIIFILEFSSNSNISYFTRLIFFCLFIIAFFYIFIITNIYIDINESNKLKNIYENSQNKNLKYLSFYRNYKDIKDESDFFINFLKEIFGINKIIDNNLFNKSLFNIDIGIPPYIPRDVSDINMVENLLEFDIEGNIGDYESLSLLTKLKEYFKVDSFKSIILFLLILLGCIGIITLIVFLFVYSTGGKLLNSIFNKDNYDSYILFYYAFIPFLLAFMIIIIIILTKEYNTYINAYILYKPNSLYRKNLNNINEIFNKILENDKAYVENNSTCKNVVNAIQLVIYSNIFKESSIKKPAILDDKKSECYTKNSIYDNNDNYISAVENIIPEFIYLPKCESNDYIDYNKIKAYDFEYTINRKTNIFYSKTKCSSINNQLLIDIIKNTSPSELYEAVIINKKDNVNIYTDNFKQQLKFAISNILNKQTYNKKKELKYTTNYEHNNQLTYIGELELKDYNQVNYQIQLDKDITSLIDIIAEEYAKYIKILFQYNIQTIQALCGCAKIKDITSEGNKYSDFIGKIPNVVNGTYNTGKSKDYSLNIKKDYIDRFIRTSQIFFTKINKIFSTKLKVSDKNLKLTKYIVKNYNEYQTYISEKYNKNELQLIKQSEASIDKFKYTDIEEIDKLIKPKIYNNLNELNEIIKIYNDSDAEIIKKIRNSEDEFKKNKDELIRLKDLYISQFKNKYYNNTNYYVQLIFDYKLEFIDKYINLYNNINNLIKPSELTKEETKNKLQLYYNEYDNFRTDYEAKYTTIKLIEEDIYKLNTDIKYSDNITTEENNSKHIHELSVNTSFIIYIVVICYIILLILTKYIK